jgi:hypothetical protein
MRRNIDMKRMVVMLAVVAALVASGEASAMIQGPCVGRCVRDRGEQADSYCIEACAGGGVDVGCAVSADGCCNEYFMDSDPDCGSNCGTAVVGPGGACDPACNQCGEGYSCQETAPDSGEFICK